MEEVGLCVPTWGSKFWLLSLREEALLAEVDGISVSICWWEKILRWLGDDTSKGCWLVVIDRWEGDNETISGIAANGGSGGWVGWDPIWEGQ